ncbi:LysR family transcriptional regulator [Bordetella genomosp. 8]|uniref:LysR family transcriptional regulator n=1 Tax=Bordetella genomosp. 8 TaxID=1416806 RepID=A0A1W6YML9_9BORD|nr:LysR family transcriptional regulator [Bordetella genomosp. 8]ARP82189.1 LysR family transcriptional regulator [Bordetella genomosp. 8]
MTGAEFAELNAFVAVAQERSFRRAARQLGVSPSALSRTIRSLEERLAVRLLNRTTRSVAPTEAGQTLFERLRQGIGAIEGAVRDSASHQTRPKGVVRINLPQITAHLVVLPELKAFTRAYPDVELDLVVDDNMVDVVAKGFDAGVRVGAALHQDMVAVRLTPDLRMAVVGAPAYFAQRPPPDTPRDLRDHRCVTYRWDDTGALYRWNFVGPDGPLDVEVRNVLTVNDSDILLASALQGAALAFLPESFVASFLESGQLIRVLDEWCKPFSGLYIYYPERAYTPAPLRAFIDFFRLDGSGAAGPG